MSLQQLSRLIDLPDGDLQQVLDYAGTLSKPEAAEHFNNLLGESPQAIDFIAAFNARRQDPKPAAAASSSSAVTEADAVPKSKRPPNKKKKAPLHALPPRQLAPGSDQGPAGGAAYSKKAFQDDYLPVKASPVASASSSPKPTANAGARLPPSAGGSLVSDLLAAPKSQPGSKPNSRPGSNVPSRTSTPKPAGRAGTSTKVTIAGGTPMHGASTALTDLDAAIRLLEMSTNPTLGAKDDASRKCNCVATRHPLQTAAPNCMKCGKVICVKEGLGPCTYCGTPLLTPDDVQAMIKELRAERGRERMAADREAHRKADVSGTPRPFSKPKDGSDLSLAEAKAREHRDKLLGFQAQNARRTTVRDEAADFDYSMATGGAGSMWATPEERAKEFRRQQKLLREAEWNDRPEYEKRRQVVSIDLVGGKVVKKMAAVERPPTPEEDIGSGGASLAPEDDSRTHRTGGGGAFSKNPLLGPLIKPVFTPTGDKDKELEGRHSKPTRWRRVQDDLDDNEAVILDGGVYGAQNLDPMAVGTDEPGCG